MNILKKRYPPEEDSAIFTFEFALLLLYVTFGMRGQYIEIGAAIVYQLLAVLYCIDKRVKNAQYA